MTPSLTARGIGEGLLVFLAHALLVVVGLATFGLVASTSAIVALAGIVAFIAFGRFVFLGERGRLAYLLGAGAAAALYPAAFAIVDSADAAGPDFGIVISFFRAFAWPDAVTPALALCVSMLCAAGAGLAVRSFGRRAE